VPILGQTNFDKALYEVLQQRKVRAKNSAGLSGFSPKRPVPNPESGGLGFQKFEHQTPESPTLN
jgi:hypothetical protein